MTNFNRTDDECNHLAELRRLLEDGEELSLDELAEVIGANQFELEQLQRLLDDG